LRLAALIGPTARHIECADDVPGKLER